MCDEASECSLYDDVRENSISIVELEEVTNKKIKELEERIKKLENR
jgi:hypothetical protein|tara:strand:+ start:980 stop:1117 length:138 start_codon:yes stop_codon:yes gene_type:complete